MSEWLLRWQYGPRYRQWLTLAGATLLLLWLIAWCGLQPLRSSRQALAQQYQQLQQQYQARMTQLLRQPSLLTQQQQNQQLLASLQPVDATAFSLTTLMQYGAALEKWQPATQGGELTLLVSWTQFQRLLAYLASRQPPVMINGLLLQRNGEGLRMTLSLGDADEE